MSTGNQRGVLFNNWVKAYFCSLKNFLKKEALQASGNYRQFCAPFLCRLSNYIKRASLRLSVEIRASVSIEAAISIPIFLFCFLEVLSLLNYISVYSGVLYAMKTTGDTACVYGYAYDLVADESKEVSIGEVVVSSLIFSEVYLDAQVRQQCSGSIYESTIQNGVSGISLLGSYVDREESDISIVARYIMEPLITFAGTELPVMCRYYGKLWTGYPDEESETSQEYVFITENGSVYHRTESCTHLRLSIQSVSASALQELRNEDGGRYTACFICCSDEQSREMYYITDSGDRYHVELACSGLKRTVYRVEKEEIAEMPSCSRCGQKENSQ